MATWPNFTKIVAENRQKKTKIAKNNTKKLTWASCRVQHESHWNLLSLQRVSVLLKFFKQLVIEVFCSTSIDRSKKSSSLLVTVSQLRQRVSLVKMPWKMSEIQVGFLLSGWSLFIGVLLPLPLCCWLLRAGAAHSTAKFHMRKTFASEIIPAIRGVFSFVLWERQNRGSTQGLLVRTHPHKLLHPLKLRVAVGVLRRA